MNIVKCETIRQVKSIDGEVRLYKNVWSDNHITYDVYKSTDSFTTSKSICGLKKEETANKRFDKYCNELVLLSRVQLPRYPISTNSAILQKR